MPADAAVPPPEPPRTLTTVQPYQDLAPFLHGAETMHIDLAPFSLTREQVAERYVAAGFTIKPRTVSLYAQQGRLRARKVAAKNGLERYLFDPASVDDDIAERRQGPRATPLPRQSMPQRRRRDGHGRPRRCIAMHAPSMHADLRAKEIRVAVLETELRMERDARIRAERRADQEANRSLALAQQNGEFSQRVAMLEAPKEELAAARARCRSRHPPTMQSRVHRSCAAFSRETNRCNNGAPASSRNEASRPVVPPLLSGRPPG